MDSVKSVVILNEGLVEQNDQEQGLKIESDHAPVIIELK